MKKNQIALLCLTAVVMLAVWYIKSPLNINKDDDNSLIVSGESTRLDALKQMRDANKKKEERIKELQEFIARFSANASKSKQATSRKKSLEKIELEEIKPSNRKYPYVDFKPDREQGKEVLEVKNICKTYQAENGEIEALKDINFCVNEGEYISIIGPSGCGKSTLLSIIAGLETKTSGEIVKLLKQFYSKLLLEKWNQILENLYGEQQLLKIISQKIIITYLNQI